MVTDRGIDCINQEMAHLCSLFNISHSQRTPFSPWTNGLVKVQNRNLGTHLRLFLQNLPTDWSFQTQIMLTLTTLFLFLNSNSPHMKLFFTHILVFHYPFPPI